MKSSFIVKLIPLISTLLFIIILGISNFNKNTRLRLLIWNTPTLSLGTYIAISTTSGFVLSYFITNSIANNMQPKLKRVIKYTIDNKDEYNLDNDNIEKNDNYDNILIERDLKDPLPTLNANFRVIGKVSKNNTYYNDNEEFASSNEEEFQNNDISPNSFNKQTNENISDWYDYSHERW
tara:strand:+ start:271 stop:807 length:537 start_codon:yes stop_codon:yes gene_type:complete